MKVFKLNIKELMGDESMIIFVDCASTWTVSNGKIVKMKADGNPRPFIGCLLGIINDGIEIDFEEALEEIDKMDVDQPSRMLLLEIVLRKSLE